MATEIEIYRRQFIDEVRDILEKINEDILKAESRPEDKEILNSIFRGIHTIKGSAGTFDLNELSEFAHGLEGLLDALRSGNICLTPEIVDVILEGIDHIGEMIESIERGGTLQFKKELADRFRDFYVKEQYDDSRKTCDVQKEEKVLANQQPDTSSEVTRIFKEHVSKGLKVFSIKVDYTSEVFENGFDPLVLLKNLRSSCTMYYVPRYSIPIPNLIDFKPLHLYLKPTVYIAGRMAREDIEGLAFDSSLITVNEVRIAETTPTSDKGMKEIDREMLDEFLDGSRELLESMEKAIISYEKSDSRESLNEIFRAVHTIKGDAGCIGLKVLVDFAHSFETMLDRLRKGKIKRSPDVIDTLLSGRDGMKGMIDCVARGTMPVYPDIHQHICEYLKEGNIPARDKILTLPDDTKNIFIEQARQYKGVLSENINPLPLDGARLKMIKRSLEGLDQAARFVGITELGMIIQKALTAIDAPDNSLLSRAVDDVLLFLDGIEKGPRRLGEILVRDGKITGEDVQDALSKQKNIGEILIDEKKVSPQDVQEAVRKQQLMETANQIKVTSETGIRTMRVDERKIERMSDMVGELLVSKNTFEHLISKISSMDTLSRADLKSLKDNLYLLSRVTNDMHHGIMSLRMVPIKGIFQKFGRVVRDISRKQKKMIDLITEGDDTEVDKKIADMLSEPLIHLIRNSCDHGIEQPDERRAAGKPEKGTVILNASQEGSNLIIKIVDDGRGVNRQKLYEKAKSMGIDIASPDDNSLLDTMFMPGVSTKTEVTDVSGRGVGMDVVRTAVNTLGGDVNVESEEGKGTEITLSIPMTMGINEALLVEINERTYALPLDYIIESIKIKPEKLIRHRDGLLFHYRDEVLSVLKLGDILSGSQSNNGKFKDAEIPIVILKIGMGKFAVMVDRLFKKMEIAIKPVPDSLSMIEVIGGVSILGDGRVVLVLNPERLF